MIPDCDKIQLSVNQGTLSTSQRSSSLGTVAENVGEASREVEEDNAVEETVDEADELAAELTALITPGPIYNGVELSISHWISCTRRRERVVRRRRLNSRRLGLEGYQQAQSKDEGVR